MTPAAGVPFASRLDTTLLEREDEALAECGSRPVQRLERWPMGGIFKALRCRPRRFERSCQLRQRPFTTRKSKKHGRLSLCVRGDVVCTLDFLARRWNILRFIQAPRQHGRQDFGRIEKRLFLRLTFGKSVLQLDELNQKSPVLLRFNGCRVSNVHARASLQLDARLALYRGEKAGAEIAGTMNRDRNGFSVLRENVVAAVNAIEHPPRSLQHCDDVFASHTCHDRSRVIQMQSARERVATSHKVAKNGEVILPDGAMRLAPE